MQLECAREVCHKRRAPERERHRTRADRFRNPQIAWDPRRRQIDKADAIIAIIIIVMIVRFI
jgi:hypothetical protein